MLLSVENLTVYYGKVKAIENISFSIEANEIVALLGPNGSGKSTSLKAIAGLLHHYEGKMIKGSISYNGKDISTIKTHDLAKHGISLIPERRHIFPTMTVYENLEMGGFSLKSKQSLKPKIEYVYSLFPRLKERHKQIAGTMSTGEQQMLAIGQSLLINPKLILADEPSLGLSPNYVNSIFQAFHDINKSGVSILLVEQNTFKALEASHRAYILDIGKNKLDGEPHILRDNPIVKNIYLGGS